MKTKQKNVKEEPDPSRLSPETTVCLTVNAPFRGRPFVSNKKLTQEERDNLESALDSQEELLIVIVGDLNLKCRYSRSVFAVSDRQIYGFDETFPDGVKHFEFAQRYHEDGTLFSEEENAADPKTIISREYSAEWKQGDEPYYPVNDDANNALYEQYKALAEKEENVIFGGRLGEYKYYDMDQVIKVALEKAEAEA